MISLLRIGALLLVIPATFFICIVFVRMLIFLFSELPCRVLGLIYSRSAQENKDTGEGVARMYILYSGVDFVRQILTGDTFPPYAYTPLGTLNWWFYRKFSDWYYYDASGKLIGYPGDKDGYVLAKIVSFFETGVVFALALSVAISLIIGVSTIFITLTKRNQQNS